VYSIYGRVMVSAFGEERCGRMPSHLCLEIPEPSYFFSVTLKINPEFI
jgi:hypothetical protein